MQKKTTSLSIFSVILFFISGFLFFFNNTVKSSDLKATGNIIVEIMGLRNNDGTTMVGLYNDANGFPGTPEKNSIIKGIKGTITDKKSIVEIKDMPYGVYAIAVFHDENNNETIDTGMYGIPKEGIAYSNNAELQFGPPKFDDAKFELKSAEVKQVLNMVYFQN